MSYSRKILSFLNAALVIGVSSAALAQSAPPSVPADAYHEWPATPSLAKGPETGANFNAMDSEGAGAIPSLPLEVQTMNGVTYITGGIGDEELAQIKASEHQYNLHLLVSATGGAFISDVSISVTDTVGKQLVSVTGAGPYFYALLPVGSYNVELSEGSEVKKFPIKIDAKHPNVKKVVEFKEAGGVSSPHQPTATVE